LIDVTRPAGPIVSSIGGAPTIEQRLFSHQIRIPPGISLVSGNSRTHNTTDLNDILQFSGIAAISNKPNTQIIHERPQ